MGDWRIHPDDSRGPQGSPDFGRLLGRGEDPMAWSFPLFVWHGVRLRMHAVVPIWAAAEIAAASFGGRARAASAALAVVAFVFAAVWRELIKGLAWRAAFVEMPVGVVWPLGGLNVMGGRGRRSETGSGTGVRKEWWGLIAGGVWTGSWAMVVWLGNFGPLVFNPLDPLAVPMATTVSIGLAAWWMYVAGICLTLCNALLPVAPFDLGRLLRREGPSIDPERAHGEARVGYVTAMTLFVAAAAMGHTRLMAVAAIGALVTALDGRRGMLDFRAAGSGGRRGEWAPGTDFESEIGRALGRGPEMIEEESAPPTLDDVLEKISREGLASLKPNERTVLEEERRRRLLNDRGSSDRPPRV